MGGWGPNLQVTAVSVGGDREGGRGEVYFDTGLGLADGEDRLGVWGGAQANLSGAAAGETEVWLRLNGEQAVFNFEQHGLAALGGFGQFAHFGQ